MRADTCTDTCTDAVAEVVADPRIRAFGVLLETTARLERIAAKALERNAGISHSMFEVLLRLADAPDRRLPMRDLSRILTLTSGGTTRLVDRMLAAGLVRRSQSEADRRVQLISLTASGESKLLAAAAGHVATLEWLFVAPLPPHELAQMVRALDRLGRVRADLP